MSLIEFLFVDTHRLDSYFEQIEAPVTYDKVPVWTAGISLAGPKAGGTQSPQARQWTKYEKVKALIKYLKENKLLEYERERRKSDKGNEFRLEVCEAREVFIPPDSSRFPDFKGLNMWISPSIGQPGPGMLFLIEDYQGGDLCVVTQPSGYSALRTLLRDLRETVVGRLVPDKLPNWQDYDIVETQFAEDPIGFLTNLGARGSDARKIQTLYRVRNTLLDCSPSSSSWREVSEEDLKWNTRSGVATVGYPIFIATGETPALF